MSIEAIPIDELKTLIDDMIVGKPMDPEAAKRSLAILSREREELRQRIGVRQWSAELLSDVRND